MRLEEYPRVKDRVPKLPGFRLEESIMNPDDGAPGCLSGVRHRDTRWVTT